jgi:hypothetical protein
MNKRFSEKLKVWIIDFGPNTETTREGIAEEEVRRDLIKSGEQLLWDVHCEALDPKRTADENLIGTNKRFASMMLRVIRSNDKLGRRMLYLTLAIAIMTAAILYFTYLMWQQSHSSQPSPTPPITQAPR